MQSLALSKEAVLGNMQAVPDSLLALSHVGHKAIALKSPFKKTTKQKAQSSKLKVNGPTPVGRRQKGTAIDNGILVKM